MNTKNSLFTSALFIKLRFTITRELYIINMIMIFNVINLHLIRMIKACLHRLLVFYLKFEMVQFFYILIFKNSLSF